MQSWRVMSKVDCMDDLHIALEIERDGRCDDARNTLTSALGEAGFQVYRASEALRELINLYDVEYAEGTTGEDIRHYLETAGRALRAAYALHRQADPA